MMFFNDKYEFLIYSLQSVMYDFLYQTMNNWNWSVLLILFLSGIFTSLTPCLLSVIPLSIAYINSNNYRSHKNFFILGLNTSFIIICIIFNFLISNQINFINIIPLVSSFILMLFSLSILQVFDFSGFKKIKNFIQNSCSFQFLRNNNSMKNYVVGLLIGSSSLPCSSSIVFLVNFWLSYALNYYISLIYFIVYILGYLISMFLILNIFFKYLKISFFIKSWDIILPISGSLMFSISLFNILKQIFV